MLNAQDWALDCRYVPDIYDYDWLNLAALMLITVDIPTLALSRALMQTMLACLLIYVGSQQAHRGIAWLWALGLLLNGLALFLFVISVPPPWEPAITASNHIAMALSSMCILLGFWRLNNQPPQTWMLAVLLTIPVLSLIAWEFVWPNARFRVLATALSQAIYLFVLQQALRAPPRVEVLHIYRRLRLVVVVYLLIFIWSYVSIAEILPMSARLDSGYHRSFFSVASMLFVLTLAVSCLALQFALLAARTSDLAMIDWLTGMLNRRGFFLAAQRECDRQVDPNRQMSIVVIDIDHFKLINDEHGHAAGDEVLRTLANILKQLVDGKNPIARTGGEEFCILLLETSLEGAWQLAESIRSQCERTRVIIYGSSSTTFTLSAGVCKVEPSETIDHAIMRADRALYSAKRAGRNRVVQEVRDRSAGSEIVL